MVGSLLGRVDHYDPSKEEWTQYVERLEHFFAANGIDMEEKKRSAFLAVIGPATYKVLRNLVTSARPGEKSYKDLVDKLANSSCLSATFGIRGVQRKNSWCQLSGTSHCFGAFIL